MAEAEHGPWEDYQKTAAEEHGPWEDYQRPQSPYRLTKADEKQVASGFGSDPLGFIADTDVRTYARSITDKTSDPEDTRKRMALAAWFTRHNRGADYNFIFANLDGILAQHYNRKTTVQQAYADFQQIYSTENNPDASPWKDLAKQGMDYLKKAAPVTGLASALAENTDPNALYDLAMNSNPVSAAFNLYRRPDSTVNQIAKAGLAGLGKSAYNLLQTAMKMALAPSPEELASRLALPQEQRQILEQTDRDMQTGADKLGAKVRAQLNQIQEENTRAVLPEDWFTNFNMDWGRNALKFLAIQAPQQAAQFALAAEMGPAAFCMAIGGSSGIDKWYDLEDENPDLPESQRFLNATLTGFINSGSAWITAGVVKGKIPVLNREKIAAGTTGAIEYFLKAFGIEAGQEAVEQLSENAADIYTGKYGDPAKLDPAKFRKLLWNGVGESALAGGVFGITAASMNFNSWHDRMVAAATAKKNAEATVAALEQKENLTSGEKRQLERAKIIAEQNEPGKVLAADYVAKVYDQFDSDEAIRQSAEFQALRNSPDTDPETTDETLIEAIRAERARALHQELKHDPQDTLDAAEEIMLRFPQFKLQTYETMDQVPQEVRSAAAERGLPSLNIRAWTDDSGTVHMILDRVAPSDAAKVIGHEIIGHHGLRAVFGKDFDTFLDGVWRDHSEEIMKLSKGYNESGKTPESKRSLTEEFLANCADADQKPSWWKEFLGSIRKLLRRLFPNLRFTDTDIEAALSRSARAVRRRSASVNGMDGDVRFALCEFEDGRRFVDVKADQHLFDGLSPDEAGKLAKKIIKERFVGKVIGIDNPIFVNGKSAGEYAYPAKPFSNQDIKQAKMRASSELDNLIDAGTPLSDKTDGDSGHTHPEATGGFSYLETIFRVGKEYYRGIVNIVNNSRGRLLKDITKMENITKATSDSYGPNPKFRNLRDVSMRNITPPGEMSSENPKNPSSDLSDKSDPSDKSASNIHFSIAPVWTGSAADYDKPNLLYVGTGEGAQVYGWGLYGSSSRGVGMGYAEADVANKRNPDVLWDGKPSDVFFREMRNDKGGTTDDYWHLSALHDMLKYKKGDIDSVKQITQEDIELKEKFNQPKEDIEGLRRRLQLLEEFKDRINYWPGLPQESFTINGVKYIPGEGSMPKDEWLQSVITYLHNYDGDRKAAIRAAEYNIKHYRESSEKDALRDLLGRTEKVLSFLSDQSNAISYEGGTTGRRNLYKQTFWPDKQENLLDWDSRITDDQTQQILDKLAEEGSKDVIDFVNRERAETEETEGTEEYYAPDVLRDYIEQFMDFYEADGEYVYKQLTDVLGSPKAASEFLYRAGIDGITYIGDDSGVRNYVAFSDKDIRVDEHFRFSLSQDSEMRDIVAILKPFTGNYAVRDHEEYAAYLEKHGVKVSPDDAFILAVQAAKENLAEARKEGIRKREEWLYENYPFYREVVDFTGKTDFIIKPSHRFQGESFTGSWISPEFRKYSEKRPQGKTESDARYQNYLKRREAALAKASGHDSDEIAAAIARKWGQDELDVEKKLLDFFRNLKKQDFYRLYKKFREENIFLDEQSRKAAAEEWMKQEQARIEDEVVSLLEKGQPITEDWINENRKVYKELYRQLFDGKDAPYAPSKKDLEAINAALMQKGADAATYAQAYKAARQQAYGEFMKRLADFRDRVMKSKEDAVKLQREALDFAEKNLPPELRGDFARKIVGLLEYGTRPEAKYPEGRRMHEFRNLMNDMTKKSNAARRDQAVEKIRDLLEQYKLKRLYKGQPFSKLLGVQGEVNEIRKIFMFRPDALAAYRGMNIAEMIVRDEFTDSWNEARKRLDLSELFGDLPGRDADAAEKAFEYLKNLTTDGRNKMRDRMEERLRHLNDLRGQLVDNLTGGVVDTTGKDAKLFWDTTLKQRARLESLIQLASGLSVKDFDKSVFAKLVQEYNIAQEKEFTAMRHMDNDVHEAVEKIFGPEYKGVFGFGKFLRGLTDEVRNSGVFRTLYTAKVEKGITYHLVGKRPAQREKVNWRIAEAALNDAGENGDLLLFVPKDKNSAMKQLEKFGDCKDDFAMFMYGKKVTVYAYDAHTDAVSHFELLLSDLPSHCKTLRISDIGRRFASRQAADCAAGVRPVFSEEFGSKSVDAVFEELKADGKFNAQVEFIADLPHLESTRSELTDLSKDQALQLILTWEQDHYKDTMRWNGFDEETMKQLYKFVGEKYLEFGRWMRDYEAKHSDRLDALSRKKYGVGLPKIPNYHPARFEGVAGQTIREDRKTAIGSMSMNPNFLIARRGHLKAPDVKVGAFGVFKQHLQDQTHFIELDDVVGDLRGLFNDSKVKAAVNSTLGVKLTDEIQRRISSLATSSSQDLTAARKIFGKVYRHFVPAKLAFSIPGMMKQGAGALNYMEVMPAADFGKYFAKAIARSADFRQFRNWALKSDYVQNRLAGGLDPDLVYLANHTLDSEKYDPLLNAMMDKAMIFTQTGDAFATIYGGYSVYAYTRDQALKNGAAPTEAERIARYAWMKATDETQQGSKLTSKNYFMENSGLNRYLTMFLANPIQTMDLVMQSIDEVRLGRGGTEARTRLVRQLVVSHLVIPTAMFVITQAWRHGFKLEEWNWEEYLLDALFGSFSGALYMGMVMEAAEKLVRIVEGKPPFLFKSGDRSMPLIAAAENAIDTLYRLFKKDDLQPSDYAKGIQALGDSMIVGGAVDNRVGMAGSLLSAFGMRAAQLLHLTLDEDDSRTRRRRR